jgi:hypothetical protein
MVGKTAGCLTFSFAMTPSLCEIGFMDDEGIERGCVGGQNEHLRNSREALLPNPLIM